MFSPELFHARLSELCKAHKTSITSFTKEVLDISTSAPTGWKNGAYPSSEVIGIAAEYFRVTTDYLYGYDDQPSRHNLNLSNEEIDILRMLRDAEPAVREILLTSLRAGLSTASAQKKAAEQEEIIHVPVLGIAAAGDPIFATTDFSEFISVSAKEVNKKHRLFAVQIHGNSMEPKIPEGSHVIVDADAEVKTDGLALVGVDSNSSDPDYMVKEIRFHPGEVELYSYNESEYPAFRRSFDKILSLLKVVYICPTA
ncbi:MAG: helix-turn-helix transcriptional regulator [Clostridia bacterium]|nr:helix-turn-helix transcriptional regulator [Clostridia bacterium]